MIGLAFSRSFGPLLANRFLLGLFEVSFYPRRLDHPTSYHQHGVTDVQAVNIPLFTVITTTWYRRREQPLRIAAWYGTK